MYILISGFFYSGSSAVHDFLSSYSTIGHIPTGEFDEFKSSQMIGDYLADRIGGEYPNSAITRYLNSNRNTRIYKYIDLKLNWKKSFNLSSKDIYRFEKLIELDDNLSKTNNMDIRMSLAKEYLKTVFNIYSHNKKYLMIDQAIPFGMYEDLWQNFFTPFKLIVIKRNIYDQIADIIKNKRLFLFGQFLPLEIREKYGEGRYGHIANFIRNTAYQDRYIEHYKKNNKNCLFIYFEDFLNNFIRYKSKLEDFLEIKSTDYNSMYDYKSSKKNIGIFKSYLSDSDLNFIEKASYDFNLPESYLHQI